jgi:DNA methylase
LEHISRQIPPEAHTAMYVWHRYWSRKTWNVVGAYIENYCPPDGIVFDPFAGSGVVAIEAARRGRRAIVCHLNPVANLITETTLKPLDIIEFQRAFERIRTEVRERIEKLYSRSLTAKSSVRTLSGKITNLTAFDDEPNQTFRTACRLCCGHRRLARRADVINYDGHRVVE